MVLNSKQLIQREPTTTVNNNHRETKLHHISLKLEIEEHSSRVEGKEFHRQQTLETKECRKVEVQSKGISKG